MAKMTKKGVLLTLGLSFLALSVLALSVLIFHNTYKSEEITSRLAIFDRMYDLDNSIQGGLKDILVYGSGINITIGESDVMFRQRIPNPKRAVYNRTMQSFKSYVETNFRNVALNIGGMSNMVVLRILPSDIEYRHNLSASTISLIPASTAPKYYELNFTIYGMNITAPSNCNLATGTFSLNIYSKDDRGNSYSCLNSIDPSAETHFITPSSGGDIEIRVYGGGKLAVNSSIGAAVDAAIRVGVSASEPITLVYPPDIINIDFNEFGINKTSTVTLR